MKKIRSEDLLETEAYERAREQTVARLIEYKRPRRIPVGDRLTFLFENRETVIFQIQEMIRTEQIVKPERIQDEIDVYNELIPAEHGLSATLMIEIPDPSRIRKELERLIGIDEQVFMDVGEQTVHATFDPKQYKEDRISAVQYVRFRLGQEHSRAFSDPGVPAALVVDHPHYSARAVLAGATRASLIRDLGPAPEPSLLD